jgi:hypothetical protein
MDPGPEQGLWPGFFPLTGACPGASAPRPAETRYWTVSPHPGQGQARGAGLGLGPGRTNYLVAWCWVRSGCWVLGVVLGCRHRCLGLGCVSLGLARRVNVIGRGCSLIMPGRGWLTSVGLLV